MSRERYLWIVIAVLVVGWTLYALCACGAFDPPPLSEVACQKVCTFGNADYAGVHSGECLCMWKTRQSLSVTKAEEN